ncbi:MAG: hypothetical protein JOZ10_15345 [Acidobacteria bacterium]|nr:hypothetical protein [Acidobacteriota bacterium]MBV9146009.1 hypothetical protein [Acidobacteriota bacterium]MBV9435718.1 hypothetical protein [Acidobacteriota bacterium]
MTDLSKKIHAATLELKRLQREMQSPQGTTDPGLTELDSAALEEFKNVIDYVRQLIWTYLQAENLKRGKNIDDEVRSLRLKRVTEMLHSIQQEVKSRELKPSPAAVSFLNAVQEIADEAFQRHKPDSGKQKAS